MAHALRGRAGRGGERTEAKQGVEPGERDDPFTYQIRTFYRGTGGRDAVRMGWIDKIEVRMGWGCGLEGMEGRGG